MKIVSAQFVIRLEQDDEALDATAQIDTMMAGIGFVNAVMVTSNPSPENPDDISLSFEQAADE